MHRPEAAGAVTEDAEAPPKPECAFGAEISEDRSRASIVKAWRDPGQPVTVALVYYDPPHGAAEVLAACWMADDPVAVVVDPASQAATLLAPLAEAGVLVRKVTAQEVAVAHGEFMDLISVAGLRHLGETEMTAAVRAAAQRPLAGAKAWERRVMVDQSPLVAATLAVFGFLRWEELSAPGAWAI